MDGLIVFVAKVLIIVPVITIAWLFWQQDKEGRKKLVIFLILGGVLSILFTKVASHLYSDPRPFYNDGIKPLFTASGYNGFPSDHTLLASFLGFVALTYSRRIGIGLLILAALIGWARVAGGVHHLVDVIASFALTALASFIAYKFLQRKHSKPTARTPAARSKE
jgi:membrane-associated phospholipid phosphatase